MESDFSVKDKNVVITGGGGVLCAAMGKALAQAGARISILDFNAEAAETVCKAIRAAGGHAVAVHTNVLDRESVQQACEKSVAELGKIDALINGAGGNKKEATANDELSFFDLPADAIRWVFDLNFQGTLLPSQIFGKKMADQDHRLR